MVVHGKIVSKCVDSAGNEFHYFASSVASWKTSTDLSGLIKSMESEGYPFNLYKVNGPEDCDYFITNYAPYFEGSGKSLWIGFFDVKENE